MLGLPVTALRHTGYRLAHHVTVLALEVMTHASGANVAAVLQRVQQRVGKIVQVVADHGGELCNGIKRLQARATGLGRHLRRAAHAGGAAQSGTAG